MPRYTPTSRYRRTGEDRARVSGHATRHRLRPRSDNTTTFFTIGHSTRTIGEFADLLREHRAGDRRPLDPAVAHQPAIQPGYAAGNACALADRLRADLPGRKRSRQRILVELRVGARPRDRADVDHPLDAPATDRRTRRSSGSS